MARAMDKQLAALGVQNAARDARETARDDKVKALEAKVDAQTAKMDEHGKHLAWYAGALAAIGVCWQLVSKKFGL